MAYTEKNKFRRSPRWVNFSRSFIARKGRKCEICGITTARLYNTHHQHKDDYENLDPHRFLCVCRECHSFCHRRLKYLDNIAKNIKKFKWE